MTPWLKSINITNFRSIKGSVTIPLDASIVLVHGANATGKTSILSAIELALTGRLSALQRAEPEYQSYMLHRDCDAGSVALFANELNEIGAVSNFRLARGGADGSPLLRSSLPSHFTERCYLPQQSLGRLLELYQHARSDAAAPLALFIRELLQLDQLEWLIEGIEATVGDVRRTRRLVPEYDELEQVQQRTRTLREEPRTRLVELDREILELTAKLSAFLQLSHVETAGADILDFESHFSTGDEETRLRNLARQRLDLSALAERLRASSDAAENAQQVDLELEAKRADAEWHEWLNANRASLSKAAARASQLVQSATPEDEGTILPAIADLIEKINAMSHQVGSRVAVDDATSARVAQLDETLAKEDAQLGVLGKEIAATGATVSTLSQLLAAAHKHIQDDICPVCQRDFSETENGSLAAFVAARAGEITERGLQLEQLTKRQAAITVALMQLRQERRALESSRLTQQERVAAKLRAADLAASLQEFDLIRPLLAQGSQIAENRAAAEQLAMRGKALQSAASDSRARLDAMATQLGEAVDLRQEPWPSVAERVSARLVAEEGQLAALVEAKRMARSQCESLRRGRAARQKQEQLLASLEIRLTEAVSALERAQTRIRTMKSVANAARDVRATVVGRVFNETLNRIWRDLFVRLAPGEPFVPAFSVPDAAKGPVVARFETVYRDGEQGGTPGAMLSAGNLNTAALTLFLALHLAVEARLPCVVLDDPVQSMDDVHIAQFTALLRTLVRRHNRQVIIAVHERPLFEYLALELSPSLRDERLITVGLGRSEEGLTVAEPEFYNWKPDMLSPSTAA